jgi:hypothetical protein
MKSVGLVLRSEVGVSTYHFFENCVLVILLELRFQAESCVSGKEV